MTTLKETVIANTVEQMPCCLDILSDNGKGAWVVSLPPKLKAYQAELEALLGKVFAGRRQRPENFPLAQQLTLNWYMSKCRQFGIGEGEDWI